MKKQSGYTMVELLLACSLAVLVVGTTTYLIYYFFSEKQTLDEWSSTQIEMSLAIKNLENDLRNVARFDPTEDFLTANDGAYFGLSSVAPGNEPQDCLNDANSSVMRYTTLDRFLRSEKILRSWSESDADQGAPANELRVTADSTADSLFSATKYPAELVVVDADRRYTRRYAVGTVTMHLNYGLDPYDDQPKTDSNQQPILFNFASVLLKMPLNAAGAAITKVPAVFITGSDIYASTTYFVCLRKSDHSLVKIDTQNKTTVLFANRPKDYNISSFVVKYLGTKKGIRVDPVNFFSDLQATPQGICVNSVYVELNANLTTKAQGTQGMTSMKTKVTRGRTIFATNLNSKRALSCTQ